MQHTACMPYDSLLDQDKSGGQIRWWCKPAPAGKQVHMHHPEMQLGNHPEMQLGNHPEVQLGNHPEMQLDNDEVQSRMQLCEACSFVLTVLPWAKHQYTTGSLYKPCKKLN